MQYDKLYKEGDIYRYGFVVIQKWRIYAAHQTSDQ